MGKTTEQAQAEFYDWAQNVFRISAQGISKNEKKTDAAQKIIEAVENGQISFDGQKAVYKLAFAVGEIKEVVINPRVKTGKMLELQKTNQENQILKLFETFCSLPAAITTELDFLDFSAISEFFVFLS